MPLYIERRKSGIWRIRGSHHGVTVDRSAKTRSRGEAEAIRERWEREIYARQVHGKAPPYSFAEAVLDYQRAGGQLKYMAPVLDAFGLRDVAALRQSDLDRAALEAYPDAKPSTVNRQFYTPFIAVMTLAAHNDRCPMRTWRRPKQPEGRIDWRSPAEMEPILDAMSPRARGLAEFMLGGFPRVSEALGMLARDVSPGARRATFWQTKGGYSRHVDLPPRAQDALRAALHGVNDPDSILWRTDRDGQPWHAYDAFNLALKRACRSVAAKPLSSHTLRHTGATWRYSTERDLPRLMAAGGWRSLAMVQRYVHAGTDDLADAVKAHNWAIGGQQQAGAFRDVQ